MSAHDAATTSSPTPRIAALRRWAWAGASGLVYLLMTAWATLAIYFSNLPWEWPRAVLAAGFAAFAVWAWMIARRRCWRWGAVGLFAAVVVWFALIPPRQDRPWRADVAVLPRVVIQRDHVKIENVRNFAFQSRHDFEVRYEERSFSLAHVDSMDLFISYWRLGPIAHTFVSFNFDDGTPPLCISIETRPEVGEAFDPLASMFKQFELIYVVGDEQDLVGWRASHRHEEVFCYRIVADREGVRRLLEMYLGRINDLADRPEWYHLLSNSCTVNIFRHANSAGRARQLDLRHFLNGWVDHYLYEAGRIDTSMPFEELRQRSRITDAARSAADSPEFSTLIRQGLPMP